MKKLWLLAFILAIFSFTPFVIAQSSTISNNVDSGYDYSAYIERQDNFEKWLSITITRVNVTTFDFTFALNSSLRTDIQNCIDNIILCDRQALRDKWLTGSNLSLADILQDLLSITDMPITNLTKVGRITWTSKNYLSGFTVRVEFSGTNQRIKIGRNSVVIATGQTASGGSNFVMRSVNGTHLWAFGSVGNIPNAYKSLDGGNTWSAGIAAASATGGITSTSNVGPELVMSTAGTATFVFNISSETWSAARSPPTALSSVSRPLGLRDGSVIVFMGNGGGACQLWRTTDLGVSWSQVSAFVFPISSCSDGLKALTQTPDGYVWVLRGVGPANGGTLLFNVSNSTWANGSTIQLNNYDSNGGALISSPNGTIYAYMLNATSMTSIKISDTTKAVLAHVNVTMAFNSTLTGNQEGGGMSYDVNTKNLYFSSNNGTSVQHRVIIWNSTNDGMTWNMVTPSFVVPAPSWRPWISGWQSYYSYALNSSSNATLDIVYFNQSTPSFGLGYSSYAISAGAPIGSITLAIQSPANTTYAVTNISLSYTKTNSTQVDTCWYKLNGGSNVNLPNCINTTFIASQGNNNITVYANSSDGTLNASSSTINFFVDTVFPSVFIDAPTNTTYTTQNLSFNYRAIESNSPRCTRSLNGVNSTIANCANSTILAADGANILILYVNDTAGNENSTTVQFTADFTPPVVNVISPTNTTYTSVHTVPLTFTAYDTTSPITSCSYTFNGGPSNPLPGCINSTLNISSLGSQTLVLTVTDAQSNTNVTTVKFTVSNNAPSVTLTSPTNITYYALNAKLDINFSVSDTDLDECWYQIDSNPIVPLPGCTSTSITGAATGWHRFYLYANDSWSAQSFQQVNYTMIQGINVSVTLPNGTLLSNFNLVSRNSTTTITVSGLNSPAIVNYDQIARGLNVNFTVTKTGYDNETWLNDINSTMGLVQHTFTIYPLTNVSFGAEGYGTFTNWYLEIANSTADIYINTTVPNVYVVSNRRLYSGSNTFYGSTVGDFYDGNIIQSIDQNIGYNILINTTPIVAQIWAQDELTSVKKYWNAQFTLTSTNVTAAYVTAIRKSTYPCLYDGDNSTSCFGGDSTSSPNSGGVKVTIGQDWNNATYKLGYDYVSTGTGCGSGFWYVYAKNNNNQDVLLYSDSVVNPPVGTYKYTAFITVPNSNRTEFPKAIDFWLNFTVTRCQVQATSAGFTEFNQVNNTAGYTYVDDYTVSIPTTLLNAYQSIVGQFIGEVDNQQEYTTIRSYYYTLSSVSTSNLVAYLLRDVGNNGYYQYFTVLDGNNQPIQGATMTLGRWYGGIENTVAQCETNPSGTCQIWMQSNQPLYSLRVSANGYNTYYNQSATYVNGQGMAYIYLSTGQTVVLSNPFSGITSEITPEDAYWNNATNVTCTVTAIDGNLNWMRMNVTRLTAFNNRTNFATIYTNSNPSGTSMQVELNAIGQFQVRCEYNFVSNATGTTTIYETANTKTYWVYSDTLENSASTSGIDPIFALIIALGIILIVCAPIAMISPTYGLITAMFLLLIFAWVGMIPAVMIGGNVVSGWYIAGLGILTTLALLYLRSYI